MRGLLAALALFGAAEARAQATMSLDPVLMAWVYADTPPLQDIARELRGDLEARLGGQFLVVPLAMVPQYESYDASVYLDSCPANQRVECGYVIGARASADWAVVGQILAGTPGRPPEVLLSVVHVDGAREVISFSSTVTPDNHHAIADGLGLVLEQVIGGMVDLEAPPPSTGRDLWALRQERRDERRRVADDVETSTGGLDELTRQIVARDDRPRVELSDLAQYQDREDGTPWGQLGLGEKEYVRYRNSGLSIDAWRDLRRGRLGQVRIRGLGGFGAGPFHHYYDGRYVLAAADLQLAAVRSYQQVEGGGGSIFGLELGLGVHPWLDVHAGAATRSVGYRAQIYQEVEDEPGTVTPPIEVLRTTTEWRFGVTVSPLPTYGVRPTGTVQLGLWSGVPVDRVIGLPPALRAFPRPAAIFLHLAPGVEISAGKSVVLFSRAHVQLRVAGNSFDERDSGEDLLVQQAPEPDPAGPLAFDWVFGVDVPIGPLFGGGS